MGFSTVQINKPADVRMELVATSDKALVQYLGKKIPVLTVGREYNHAIRWDQADNGKLFASYGIMFAEFE